MIGDVPSAGRDTPLFELYGPASRGLPIALTDRTGRIEAMILPETVFARLAGDQPAAA